MNKNYFKIAMYTILLLVVHVVLNFSVHYIEHKQMLIEVSKLLEFKIYFNNLVLTLALHVGLVFFIVYYFNGYGVKNKTNGEYGTASWMKESEVKSNFSFTYREKDSKINELKTSFFEKVRNSTSFFSFKKKKAGLIVGWKGKKAIVDSELNHTIIIGSTGSGKSQGVIFPTIDLLSRGYSDVSVIPTFLIIVGAAIGIYFYNQYIYVFGVIILITLCHFFYKIKNASLEQDSMIIGDPKGEFFKGTANLLKKRKYDIKLLNLFNPNHSDSWNPLQIPYEELLKGNIEEAQSLVQTIAHSFHDEAQAKDPIWSESAKSLSVCLFYSQLEDAINLNKPELATISEALNKYAVLSSKAYGGNEKDKTQLNRYFEKRADSWVGKMFLGTFGTMPKATFGGVVANWKAKLRVFEDARISRMTSKNTIDLEKIGKEKSAVYLYVPETDKSRSVLASLFIDQLYYALDRYTKTLKSNTLPIRVNFLLDEFANLPTINEMDGKISMARSKNIRLLMVVQDFTQLVQQYGKEIANTIKNNCNNLFYLLTNENETAEEISKLLGKETISYQTSSQSFGTGQGGGNLSTSFIARDLMTAEELRQLPIWNNVLISTRKKPLKTKTKPQYKYLKIDNLVVEDVEIKIEHSNVKVQSNDVYLKMLNS